MAKEKEVKLPIPQTIVSLNRFWFRDSKTGKRIRKTEIQKYLRGLYPNNQLKLIR